MGYVRFCYSCNSLRSWRFLLVGSPESRARGPKRVAKPRGNGARATRNLAVKPLVDASSPRLSRLPPHFPRSCTTRFGTAFPPTKTASYAGYSCTGKHAISYTESSGSLASRWSPAETCKLLRSSQTKEIKYF